MSAMEKAHGKQAKEYERVLKVSCLPFAAQILCNADTAVVDHLQPSPRGPPLRPECRRYCRLLREHARQHTGYDQH